MVLTVEERLSFCWGTRKPDLGIVHMECKLLGGVSVWQEQGAGREP